MTQRDLYGSCPKCGRGSRAFQALVTFNQEVYLFYKCRCGHSWKERIHSEYTISVIGDRVPLMRRERLKSSNPYF